MEEITLLNFFGEEYIQYQERVPSGLPFIRGFRHDPDCEDQTSFHTDKRNETDDDDDAADNNERIVLEIAKADGDLRRSIGSGGLEHSRNRRYSGTYDNCDDQDASSLV
uniref:Uncharacterized protein n=1 Tax=Anopheles maculatus TaxID=74869 RepID=A0A182T5X7_9DIPT